MKILIDGDSCPCRVLRDTERIAKRNRVECHMYCDSRRAMESGYSEIHFVDARRDGADFAIVNSCGLDDIVVTSDGGLAAMALARRARVLNPYGGEYDDRNITAVLARRAAVASARRGGRPVRRDRGGTLDRSESYRSALCRLLERDDKDKEERRR